MSINANVQPMSHEDAMKMLRSQSQVFPSVVTICDGHAVAALAGEDGNPNRVVCMFHADDGAVLSLEVPLPPATVTNEPEEQLVARVEYAIERGHDIAVAKAWAVFN